MGVKRELLIISAADGEIVDSASLYFDSAQTVVDYEQNFMAVVTSYSVSEKVVYFFDIQDGKVEEISNVTIERSITQAAIGENKTFYFGTGMAVFECKVTGNGVSTPRKVFEPNISFTGFFYKDGKAYISNNVGDIETYEKTDGKFVYKTTVDWGDSDSLIYYDGEGRIFVFDYKGNSAILQLQDLRMETFKIGTSITHAALNGREVVCLKAAEEITFYSIEGISSFGFFQKAQVFIYIFLGITVVVFAIAVICCFRKGREKVQEVCAEINKSKAVYVYLLPIFFLLVMFILYPIFRGFALAFQDYVPGVKADFVGLDNFKELFSTPEFWASFKNMVIFLVWDIVRAIVFPIFFAEALHALTNRRMQYWLRLIMYIPGVLPGVAATLLWSEGILGSEGVIGQLCGLVGLEKYVTWNWLGNASTAKWGLMFMGFPWVGQYLIYYGALTSIPSSLYEAAELDGFSWFKRIIKIDVPMIFAQIKYVFVTTFITSIQNYSRVYLTTGGAFDTDIPALQLYNSITKHQNYGMAAAMGIVLFAILFFFSFRSLKSKSKGY